MEYLIASTPIIAWFSWFCGRLQNGCKYDRLDKAIEKHLKECGWENYDDFWWIGTMKIEKSCRYTMLEALHLESGRRKEATKCKTN